MKAYWGADTKDDQKPTLNLAPSPESGHFHGHEPMLFPCISCVFSMDSERASQIELNCVWDHGCTNAPTCHPTPCVMDAFKGFDGHLWAILERAKQ